MAGTQIKLGDLLIGEGVLTKRTLQTALDYQGRHAGKHKLGEILLLLELASEDQIVNALSRKLGIRSVDLNEVRAIDREVLNIVPRTLSEEELVLPLTVEKRGASRRLQLAMADPTNLTSFDNIQFRLGMPIDPLLTTISQVRRAIRRFYGALHSR